MQVHLVKCRKNHPNSGIVICKFNATHHIPALQEASHLACCPDRKMVEVCKYEHQGNIPRIQVAEKYRGRENLDNSEEEEEDWEKEVTNMTYIPNEKIVNKQVLRKLNGVTPSLRKEFRAQEINRLNMLKNLADEEQSKKVKEIRKPIGNVRMHDVYSMDSIISEIGQMGIRSESDSKSSTPGFDDLTLAAKKMPRGRGRRRWTDPAV